MASSDIQGTVVDDQGNPISGATVYLFKPAATDPVVVSTTTDTNGNYIFNNHSDGDGSSQQWHVVAEYDDGTNKYNTTSKPYVTAQLSPAIPDGTVDNFNDVENGGIYESEDSLATYYIGDTGSFDRVASDLWGGKMLDANAAEVELISTPGDGLNAYPAKGDTFACVVRVQTDTAPRLRYGLADANNFYMVEIKSDGSVTLYKKESGSFSTLDSGSTTVSDGDEFDIEIQWGSDDSHTVDIYPFDPTNNSRDTSAATLTVASDSTFSNNAGVGYRQGGDASPATNCEWDQFRITS